MRTTIHSRQSLLDIAVQECGTFEAAWELAERNGLALTDELTTGAVIDYLPEQVASKQVVDRLAARRIRPATAATKEDAATAPWGGIGYMGIDVDFIVR